MDPKASSPIQDFSLSEKSNPQQDVQSLWEHWDKAQNEETPSELVKGYNLAGVIIFIAGTLLQSLGSGFLKLHVAPMFIFVGAVILVVKKVKKLWSQRSLSS